MPFEIKKHYFNELESTNKYAKQLSKQGATEGTVIIASKQLRGYGRLGRCFHSPEESGLYMSLILRPEATPDSALLITTAAACAVARAIEETGGKNALIKWVNDIYIDNRKVCGILCEGSIDPSSALLEYAVLGIGVNLYIPENGFPKDIANIAGSVFSRPCNKNTKEELTDRILNNFAEYYEKLSEKEYYKLYKEKCFIVGKTLTVNKAGSSFIAKACDIDENFRLIVTDENNNRIILDSGEVSIKL